MDEDRARSSNSTMDQASDHDAEPSTESVESDATGR